MASREMNRRSLCKMIVTMGMLTVIQPFKELAAVEPPETQAPNEPPQPLHQGKQRIVVCACRPRFLNGGMTSRKKREIDQGSVNDL